MFERLGFCSMIFLILLKVCGGFVEGFVEGLSLANTGLLKVLKVSSRIYMCARARACVHGKKLSTLSTPSTDNINSECLCGFQAVEGLLRVCGGFMSGSLREKMPETAAFIDAMREAFGAEMVHAQIRRGMRGEPTFYACENGMTVGSQLRVSGFELAADALVDKHGNAKAGDAKRK